MGGRFDYPHYYMLNLVSDAGGGLEHKNSFLTMSSRFATRTRRSYLSWLGLAAHEYFHNWNIKRLRPVELGPFDYENEVHSKSLWIGEGFTDYYAGLLVKRAGPFEPRRISRRVGRSDRSCPDDTRPPRDVGRHGVVRHVDQTVST